jgi:hypothetical protein
MLERNEASQLVNAAIDNLCPGVNYARVRGGLTVEQR